MLSFQSLVLFIAAICTFDLLRRLLVAASGPLRSIPGPFLARFSRLWYLRAVSKGNFEKTNIELHRKYGKIVRVGPNLYSIDDPEAAATIYSYNVVFPKSKFFFSTVQPPGPQMANSFSESDNKRSTEWRRFFAPAYSAFLTYESSMEDCARLLDQRLREFVDAGLLVDLGHWILCFAFDVNGVVTFSKRFGFLDAGKDIDGIHETLNQRLAYTSHVGVYPSMHPYTFKLVNFIGGMTGQVDRSIDFTMKQVSERQALDKPESEGPPDMLTRLLETRAQNPEKYTDWHVLMGAFTNIVAGADTSWTSLSGILYYLLKNPESLRKLRQEIEEKSRKGTLSNPGKFREAQQMPYLQAVLKEGQRMFPATGFPLWRVVPEHGVTMAGQFFPPGTIVGINTWVAHRNSTVFGPDPDTYRPERWLDSDPERLALMDSYYMPFGMGPRSCQGKNIALMVLSKVILQLVRTYDFELDERLKDKDLETLNYWIVKQKDFKCQLKLRKAD